MTDPHPTGPCEGAAPGPCEGAAPGSDGSGPVDWDRARQAADALTRGGPRADREQIALLVQRLRRDAAACPPYVAQVTGLHAAAEAAEEFDRLVIDRTRWAHANIDTFSSVLTTPTTALAGLSTRAGRSAAGAEVGAVLALLGSRVLGQFDPFSSRLLLVAPNVLHVQQALGADLADFSLWVCLHEQTHAVQFAAAPWLVQHLRAAMNELMTSMAADASDRMTNLFRSLPEVFSSRAGSTSSAGAFLGAVLTAEEEALMGQLMAVMSMLEGHADVVMDAVGPSVIPSVASIRRGFDRRRDHPRRGDAILRRLLGLDVKLDQYRTGAQFVRGVVERVGHDGFNAAFTGAEQLPTAAEISDPAAWVNRIHG